MLGALSAKGREEGSQSVSLKVLQLDSWRPRSPGGQEVAGQILEQIRGEVTPGSVKGEWGERLASSSRQQLLGPYLNSDVCAVSQRQRAETKRTGWVVGVGKENKHRPPPPSISIIKKLSFPRIYGLFSLGNKGEVGLW